MTSLYAAPEVKHYKPRVGRRIQLVDVYKERYASKSIYHEYDMWIEKSVTRDHCRHDTTGLVTPNSDPTDFSLRTLYLHTYIIAYKRKKSV